MDAFNVRAPPLSGRPTRRRLDGQWERASMWADWSAAAGAWVGPPSKAAPAGGDWRGGSGRASTVLAGA